MTYRTIFGKSLRQLEYVVQLGKKGCTSFELLGITFNQSLDKMECNYEKCQKRIKDKLNSWGSRHLTIFGEITVIKTMCFSKFTHIASVIPSLSMSEVNEIEK